MPQDLHCRHCNRVVPMLDEREWARMERVLWDDLQQRRAGSVWAGAQAPGSSEACELYLAITGVHETDPEAIWHHRRALYGQACHACGRALHSRQASRCTRCGAVPGPAAEAPALRH